MIVGRLFPQTLVLTKKYLPPESCATQGNIDQISAWTDDNLMQINAAKTNYMIFTRTQTSFATRLKIKESPIAQVHEAKVVGVWLTSNMKWEKNTTELAKKAYARMGILTKLKYVGVSTEDLLDIFVLQIRSILEYCTVVWHSRLTAEQITTLERVQRICLKVILGDSYIDYGAALEMCNLSTLHRRRQDRCLAFAKKSLKHPLHRRMFPLNKNNSNDEHISREMYEVNYASTETYRMSAVPFLQRLLNSEKKGT